MPRDPQYQYQNNDDAAEAGAAENNRHQQQQHNEAGDKNNRHKDVPVTELDEHGLTQARESASAMELLCFEYVVVDHLSLTQCAGFAGASFNEVQHIWRDLQVQWAVAYGDGLRAVMEALQSPHPNEPRGQLDLERTLDWIFLLPILMLRKPPSANGTDAKDLKSFIQW